MLKLSLATLVALAFSLAAYAEVIDGEDFVDPTRPLFVSSVSSTTSDIDVSGFIGRVIPSSWDVSFVRASGLTPMAIVNSERVTIGDSVGGAQVLEIDRNGVTLLINEEERRISVFDTAIKARAQN